MKCCFSALIFHFHNALYKIPNSIHFVETIPIYMVSLFPEEIIQRLIQRLADTDAELNGRIVISLFNRIDGLAANPNQIRELLLGQVLGCSS